MSELSLPEKLNMSKETVLNVSKTKGIDGVVMKVKLVIDISQSMSGNFSSGFVQKVFQRFVPIAMAFDDDQEMEVYPFHDGIMKCEVNCTATNLSGYVQTEILKRYQFGGTNYAPAIKRLLADFLADKENVTLDTKKSGGLMGLFKSEIQSSVTKIPTLALFITDGDCFDEEASEKAIIEAAKHGMFIQFIGIGASAKHFLEKLDNLKGRFIDNVNFFNISTLELANCSDLTLYNKILNELPSWLKESKKLGLRS